jgi:predicted nucleotidyltransferase
MVNGHSLPGAQSVALPSTLVGSAAAIARWAAVQPNIGAVFLFGSRLREAHGPASDLDIAVALNSPADALLGDFILSADRWRNELRQLLGLPIDLQLASARESPRVWGYLQAGCTKIYPTGQVGGEHSS